MSDSVTFSNAIIMNPYVASQVQAIIEGIRLMETFVTAPLGLYSDIKMLRESLPFPEAAELPREETRERRIAYSDMTDAHDELALDAIASVGNALDTLVAIKDYPNTLAIGPGWTDQARVVLARAEQRVGGDIRAKIAATLRGLYVIVDLEATLGRPVAEVAEAALTGGANIVQLRDKTRGRGDVLPVARKIRALCEQHGALFVMNDAADVALASDAHGLHLGHTDLPVPDARRILTSPQLIGSSNSTVEDAMQSQAQGVDYLAVGPVYPTTTMGNSERPAIGVETIAKIKGLVPQPIVATGGINSGNVSEVVKAGADCACVVSAVTLADDPESATRELVDAIERAT